MNKRLIAASLIILFGLVNSPPAKAQAAAAAQYVVLLGLLQNLKANLDAVVNTVNNDAADKIRQAEIAISNSIKQLQDTIKQVNAGISVQREEIFRQTFDAMATANADLQAFSRVLYLDANNTLVHAAIIAGSLPFVNIPDYVFAADPPRLSPRSVNRQISFYGYFPDVKNTGDATAVVGNDEFPLKRYTGFRLAFDLPQKYIQKEQSYIEITIRLPRPTWHTLFRPTVSNRIYIEKTRPFTFEVRTLTENPSLWAHMPSARPYFDNADSSKTSVRKTMKATDLFSTLVNNDRDYFMNTAVLEAVSARITHGPPPCNCCDSPGGTLIRWQDTELEYSLSAPSCGDHWCSTFYHCGGGGTNAEIYIDCQFKVKRRNVPETVVAGTQKVVLRRADGKLLNVGTGWKTLDITGIYQDGDDRVQRSVLVQSDVPLAAPPLYTARYDGAGGLRIETR